MEENEAHSAEVAWNRRDLQTTDGCEGGERRTGQGQQKYKLFSQSLVPSVEKDNIEVLPSPSTPRRFLFPASPWDAAGEAWRGPAGLRSGKSAPFDSQLSCLGEAKRRLSGSLAGRVGQVVSRDPRLS
ncbi:hypothetical protein E2C01_010412 [Portunus trituberculatus]|uniref:Uncharacterized protein n=1 Tax=Portunus trituberculatus TaxID=210409 RepID=A0A5B7D8D1_PORTR|nr:hypothetical protein [Portunus trituberculatus]